MNNTAKKAVAFNYAALATAFLNECCQVLTEHFTAKMMLEDDLGGPVEEEE